MIVVDSSFFVSLFVKGDVNHEKALDTWKKLRESGIKMFAPTLILPEVCGAIVRVTKDKGYGDEVKEKIEEWLRVKVLTLKELTIKRAKMATEIAIKFNLKGADAIFVSLAQEFDAKLLTLDEEIKKRIREKVKLL